MPADTVMIGHKYILHWHMPHTHGSAVSLRFGGLQTKIKLVAVDRDIGLRIPKALADKMGIHGQATLRLQYDPYADVLRLGPVIAVLISKDHPHNERPFGSITLFCQEMVEACQLQGAFCYFTTPERLISPYQQLSGWVFQQGAWQLTTLPAPDVVNNRLTSRKYEKLASVRSFFARGKERHQMQVFNEKFLDKAEVFQALQGDETLTRYLPESHVLEDYQRLLSMCARYPTVFLKPVRGSLGKGIIRISRTPQGYYDVYYANVNGTTMKQYRSLKKLYESLKLKMKKTTYQLQQGLNLIAIAGRPVDFRALVQKGLDGAWAVTSVVARIAGGNHFVSNLARGGSLTKVRDAVARSNMLFGRQNAAARLSAAALRVARGVDTQIDAHFAELGIDLALDVQGQIWLIEVNSKPSKNDNTPLETGQKVRPSVRNVVRYARYISGFGKKDELERM
jgi:glutathione synthase/RimK-type ligase-like ATP-grasp enzyme